ncbi:MAG TPA: ABC transporter ATP-binding protein [Cellulomonas sp.]
MLAVQPQTARTAVPDADAEPIVAVDDAGFRYPGSAADAVTGVTLRVVPGELVGIVGQNGSGKTTLTKLLNGLLRPTSGRVVVDGKDTAQHTVQQMASSIGYVFQNPGHQIFARTVRAELAFGPRNLGVPPDEIERRVTEVAGFFGLTEHLETHPYRLSFPLRKATGIASVVTMRPKVLLLDEPTTGQDGRTVETIKALVRRLHADGVTVVIVSHDMPLLADVVDRVVVMRDSRVLTDASPAAVFGDRELMRSTNLHAPQVTAIAERTTVPLGLPIALTSQGLVSQVASLVRAGAPDRIAQEEPR